MFEVQQKMFASLTGDEDLMNKVNGVYDYVPEDQKMPYITFGKIESNTERTKTINGETINFTLDIWSVSKGRKEAVDILTRTENILQNPIDIDTGTIFYQYVKSRNVIEEQYGLYHATVEVEYQIDWS